MPAPITSFPHATEFVRPADRTRFDDVPYAVQDLFRGESCSILLCRTRAHESGPPLHFHHVDQAFYVLSGTMQVQLGEEVFVAGPDTVVYIPAETPHRQWNDGDEDVIHLELLVPTPAPRAQTWIPTDSTDAEGKDYYVLPLDPDGFGITERMRQRYTPEQIEKLMSQMVIQRLIDREHGVESTILYVADVYAHGGGPRTHIHDFDQFYWVLSGELSVEVALDSYVAGPDTLVVLPKGVPHRQWNGSDATERHICLIVPQPAAGPAPFDIPVIFAQAEREEFGGDDKATTAS